MTDVIDKELRRLARGDAGEMASLIRDVETHVAIDGCNFIWHCHTLKLDGNGRPKVNAFIEFLAGCVLDYAIPRSLINEAYDVFGKTKSTNKVIMLHNEARQLFTTLTNSGEGGELLLFVLTEKCLGFPQLLCKMDLKTNTQMHFHGLDGVHVGYDDNLHKLNLYYGESKLHKTYSKAISECIDSLSHYLLSTGGAGAKSKRDLQLLSRHLDLDHPQLETALVSYFNPQEDEYNSMEVRGVCLVGFNCKAYPAAANSKKIEDDVVAEVANLVPTWKKAFVTAATKCQVDSFKIHTFCIPFPDVDAFREEFRKQVGVNNGN